MKVFADIQEFCKDVKNAQKIANIKKLGNGWEKWVQMEMVYYLAQRYPIYQFAMENGLYNDNIERTDFSIIENTHGRVGVFVEMKCESSFAKDEFVGKIKSDLQRLRKLKERPNGFNVIVIVNDSSVCKNLMNIFSKESSGMAVNSYCSQCDFYIVGYYEEDKPF